MRPAPRLVAPLCAVLALLAMPALALGHVELTGSSPNAGANLDSAPSQVTITFDDELDPDLSRFTVTDAAGTKVGSGTVDLTVADRNVLRGNVSIADPGVYTVRYTVAGIDGHVLHGTFSFGYRARDNVPGPDTALPPPRSPMLAIAGIALLVAAGLLVALRRVRP